MTALRYPFVVGPRFGFRQAWAALAFLTCWAAASGCLIYTEDLLEDGDGAAGGMGGGGTGGAGAGGVGGCTNCGHLLISEVVVSPTDAEMVEIYNPLSTPVMLDDVWLADDRLYFNGVAAVTGTADFMVRFPAGSVLEAGARAAVSIGTSGEFASYHGQPPDYVIGDLRGYAPDGATLTNGSEVLILFQWDEVTPDVRDLDYVTWARTRTCASTSRGSVPTRTTRPLTASGPRLPPATEWRCIDAATTRPTRRRPTATASPVTTRPAKISPRSE